MVLSTTNRNCLGLVLLVLGFLAFQWGANQYGPAVDDPSSTRSLIAAAVVLFLFGAGSFFVFVGGFWIQTLLVIAVPWLAQTILDIIGPSDSAYPHLALALAIPYSILFFLGAVFVGGPFLVWRDSRARSHLTSKSSGRAASRHG
jgi:hypothetical protein